MEEGERNKLSKSMFAKKGFCFIINRTYAFDLNVASA